MFCRNSEERIRLAKYRLNKSPRQGKDFHKTLLKITNEKTYNQFTKRRIFQEYNKKQLNRMIDHHRTKKLSDTVKVVEA